MIRVVHPGSGSSLFTHPGSRGQKCSGSARLEMRRVPCLVMPLASSLLMSMLRWLFLLAFLLILLNIDVPGKEEKARLILQNLINK
jgi:hypothetical protein